MESTDTGADSQSVTVQAGQTASVAVQQNGTETTISLENLTVESIPGFVAVELQKDEDLQQRVQESSGLPVDQIIASADQRLSADEQQAEDEMESAGSLTDRVTQAPIFREPETSTGLIITRKFRSGLNPVSPRANLRVSPQANPPASLLVNQVTRILLQQTSQ